MNAAGPRREPHVGRGASGWTYWGAADSAADWEKGLTLAQQRGDVVVAAKENPAPGGWGAGPSRTRVCDRQPWRANLTSFTTLQLDGEKAARRRPSK